MRLCNANPLSFRATYVARVAIVAGVWSTPSWSATYSRAYACEMMLWHGNWPWLMMTRQDVAWIYDGCAGIDLYLSFDRYSRDRPIPVFCLAGLSVAFNAASVVCSVRAAYRDLNFARAERD